MSPFFEDAAHLLKMLTAQGLTVRSPADYVSVIVRIANAVTGHRASRLTHAAAAARLLGDLEAEMLVSVRPAARPKVVAMLGSFIGNVLMQAASCASVRRRG